MRDISSQRTRAAGVGKNGGKTREGKMQGKRGTQGKNSIRLMICHTARAARGLGGSERDGLSGAKETAAADKR